MSYWAVLDGERLVATVRRAGGSRSGPQPWRLLWAHQPPPGRPAAQLHGERHEAIAAALRAHPQATVRQYNGRGELVR